MNKMLLRNNFPKIQERVMIVGKIPEIRINFYQRVLNTTQKLFMNKFSIFSFVCVCDISWTTTTTIKHISQMFF